MCEAGFGSKQSGGISIPFRLVVFEMSANEVAIFVTNVSLKQASSPHTDEHYSTFLCFTTRCFDLEVDKDMRFPWEMKSS